jgi:hypothetical protein
VLYKRLVPEKLTLLTPFFTHAYLPVGKAEMGVGEWQTLFVILKSGPSVPVPVQAGTFSLLWFSYI